MNLRWIVFTDLDGTLLDHSTYSFKPALPALRVLSEREIPLVLCTSKTRAEIEPIRARLRNSAPFISENGGAIFIPKGYFRADFRFHKEDAVYRIIELGTPYPVLREAFERIRRDLPGSAVGFGDLRAEEIAPLCGLPVSEARLAKEREYDEPFLIDDSPRAETMRRLAERSGLRITRGGRFYHLTGANDKGRAVRILSENYAREWGYVRTIGLGDSQNDLPMLEAVDHPVLVQRPGGGYDPEVQLKGLTRATAPGPEGWARAVLSLIAKIS